MPGAKILVVDDSSLSRSMLSSILTSQGYTVVQAVDGEDALRQFSDAQPDLILMDVVMPKMNGWDACKRIRDTREGTNVPIAVITSKTSSRDMLQCYEVGANEFIRKPVDQEELVGTVARLLAGADGAPKP